MKTGYLPFLSTGLIAALLVTASRAAVYPYAEYHLGEAGSLSGIEKCPQDSSGANRHFFDGNYGSSGSAAAIISNSTSPAAIGSTASLDTTPIGDQSWEGYYTSYATSLPKNNFAFGIFVQSPGYGTPNGSSIFTLGEDVNSFEIVLDNAGWRARPYSQTDSIPGLPGTFTPNTWVHLAVIRTGNVSRFYIDGVDQGGSFTTEPVHNYPLLARNIGGSNSTFNGLIDEARVVTFTEGETTANVIAALQAGVIPTAFVNVGSTAAYAKASLSPSEPSVFRIGGAVRDSVRILDPGGLGVTGTAPQKHVIQISQEGFFAAGRYPLITYAGAIGGQGFAGLELAAVPGRFTASLENNTANSTIDLVISGPDGITWTGSGGNVWDLASANNWVLNGTSTPASFLNQDHVFFNDATAAAVNTITIAETVSPGSFLVDASENYTFSGAEISGSTALTKRGTGTLTLTNPNTNTGAVSINAGTLSVGDGGSSGSLGSGEISLNGGQLVVNRSGADLSLPNLIKGSGAIQKLGTGRLILGPSAPSYYFNGPVTIAAGEVVAGGDNCFSLSTGVTIAAGGAFDVSGFASVNKITISGGGNGGGAIKNNSGTANLRALTGGVVLAGDAGVGGNTDWGMSNRSDGYPFRPYVSGDFKLTKVGNGTIAFDETDISVKHIVIESGRLLADTGTAISNSPAGTITINGGSLDFGQNYFFPISCAKPIVLNGGTLSANGGPYVDILI
ncbi:MAG: hypothetical protein JWO82_764, partial [Akkermansiaceae bacterium]|nr:hypothetical protein [Akkermansiaceae bacterium]